MRIFVSSSFQDLQEYRVAAIRVLRQLGHEVVAMEDVVAASDVPLSKMLDMVERCELYVGLFAWRYGFVPKTGASPGADPADPKVAGATYGRTSITHYEYLHAKAKKIDCSMTVSVGYATRRSASPLPRTGCREAPFGSRPRR